MDEHRMGLKPILRKVWAKRGQRPITVVRPRYEWLYVYGFVRPETGETSFWLTDSVNIETMTTILAAFVRERKRATGADLDLVLDQAGWHISDKLAVPEGLELFLLPAYSPELQPAEHLWSVLDEVVVNRVPVDLAEMECWVSRRCNELSDDKERVRRLTHFSWWPKLGVT